MKDGMICNCKQVSYMETKNLDSITVIEIISFSGANRKTFYNHFSGLSDLLCHVITTAFFRSHPGKTDRRTGKNLHRK